MDGDILKEIAKSAKFELDIFDGAIKIEGRILSPAEVEAAGLASALLASQAIKGKSRGEIAQMQEMTKKAEEGDEDQLFALLEMANTIRPEMLEQMAHREDQLIIKCVKKCSKDGQNWEPLHLVDAVERQDAKQNRLWIGMLPKKDRSAILERAMNGHKEASERLKSFRER